MTILQSTKLNYITRHHIVMAILVLPLLAFYICNIQIVQFQCEIIDSKVTYISGDEMMGCEGQ
jgi:hypothetical protein